MTVLSWWKNEAPFSPVSELHYCFYKNKKEVLKGLKINENIQCIAGVENIPFGETQQPGLFDYADGTDVMQFLLAL